MDAYPQVSQFIRQARLIEPGELVVVGVSGGADSVCLLDCLHRYGSRLIVAHLDHQLRPDSRKDADFVRRLAERYGAAFDLGSEDIRASAAASGLGLEAAGREARYRFLAKVAFECDGGYVAVGHTADDQVETVLMHLLRGAGVEGLSGMHPSTPLAGVVSTPFASDGRLIRPLLAVGRETTLAHCAQLGIEPREDPSNQDIEFLRNRIRLELLPLLQTYNPAIRSALLRTQQVMAAVGDYLESSLDEHWDRIVRSAGEGALAVHREAFLRLPVALQAACVRRILLAASGEPIPLDLANIERALAFVAAEEPSTLSLVGGITLRRAGEEAVFVREGQLASLPAYPQLAENGEVPVQVPGQAELANGWVLRARLEEVEPLGHENLIRASGGGAIGLDAGRLDLARLRLRRPRPGDRIQPLGMTGRMKLSDLFINEQIPQVARARWPVLESKGEILWVAGLRMANRAQLAPETKQALLLELLPPNDAQQA